MTQPAWMRSFRLSVLPFTPHLALGFLEALVDHQKIRLMWTSRLARHKLPVGALDHTATWGDLVIAFTGVKDVIGLFLGNPSTRCNALLNALKVTPQQLNRWGKNMKIEDATASRFLFADVYKNTAAYGTVKKEEGDKTVKEYFQSKPYVTVVAMPKGDKVFFRPTAFDASSVSYNFGLVLHETIHNVTGQTDDILKEAIGISRADEPFVPSAVVSSRLRQDCFQ